MTELDQLFKGLADPTRLRILNLLLHRELCVCDVQYVLRSPQPNISRHLTYLKNSGVVSDRRDGQRMYYRLADSKRNKLLFAFLRDVFHTSDEYARDLRSLKKAIAKGSCTAGESSALLPLARVKAAGSSRH